MYSHDLHKAPTLLVKRALYSFFLLLVTALFVFAHQAQAQELTSSQADSIKASIDGYIEVNKENVHALSIVYLSSDDKIAETYAGTLNSAGAPIDASSVYDWGEASELLIWISALQLEERGTLDLDKDIKLYLPQDFNLPPDTNKSMTFRQLMSHSSGFDRSLLNLQLKETDEIPDLQSALSQTDARQTYTPGKMVSRSSYASSLAALIISHVSGLPYEVYVDENILKPMRMYHTSLTVNMDDNIGVQTKRKQLESFDTQGTKLSYYRPAYLYAPALMVSSTPRDLMRLVRGLLNVSSEHLFQNSETYEKIFVSDMDYRTSENVRVATGLFSLATQEDKWVLIGTSGGTSTFIEMSSKTKEAIVLMSSTLDDKRFMWQIAARVFGRESFDKSEYLEPSTLWRGIYQDARSPQHGPTKIVSVLNRALVGTQDEHDLTINDLHYQQAQAGLYFRPGDLQGRNSVVFSNSTEYISIMSFFNQDYFKLPHAQLIIEYTLLFGAALGALASISGVFGLIFSKLKSMRKGTSVSLGYAPLVIYLLNIGLIAFISYIAVVLLNYTTTDFISSMQIYAYVYAISVAALLLYDMWEIHKSKDNVLKRSHELIALIAGVILMMNLIYWEIIF
ncbi:MAG: serine hydrolase domain-containing protein [Coriobacteriia bacterium]|nr:serine hydrolase domain-containing protein [Coriobacteriia bacterium]